MPSLSCIGAGLLGKTVCRLLSNQLNVQQVLNRSTDSAQQAIDFIGAGSATSWSELAAADIWLIATPDNQLETTAHKLWESGVLQLGNIVFHCSGSASSDILKFPDDKIYIASAHPIHSFANPQQSLKTFSGSHCAIEGSPEATELLSNLFANIGAKPFAIESKNKALYHAATVLACNYLVSLLETSRQLLDAAGVDSQANPLESLIRQTLDNYLTTGAEASLTGPIARGDSQTVAKHLEAIQDQPQGQLWQQVYSALGNAALPISAAQGQASEDSLAKIAALLNRPEGD
ncbi:MAG: DUF2520 domain-containing protein [Porticoccaceae bacterium]|jgi:predicted short-subunit dehydrogenase-like oxidoreductase (DUF2520 family)|nr:DUF2520 domain-containing protein [Porticoccaceae bacterium]MBT5578053.1 DUF2520 domain-containing protein [Porticoccaceae bacterium]MBT7374546.1 DUF2520 domain-containing protein [Porticoccaceae bacterium]